MLACLHSQPPRHAPSSMTSISPQSYSGNISTSVSRSAGRGNGPAQSQDPYITSPKNQKVPSPSKISASPLVASQAYVNQYHSVLETQRQAFAGERALWDIERRGLSEKIAALENLLRQYQAFPKDQSSKASKQSPARLGSLPGSKETTHNAGAPGNEIWRAGAGKSGAQPTRTFSDSSTYSPNGQDRLPSIAENVSPTKARRAFSESFQQSTAVHKPSIVGLEMLDGITFKSDVITTTNSSGSRSIQSSPAADPLSSPREAPRSLQLPPVQYTPDNLTKDAGHTPLARTTYGLDGTSSAMYSDLPTPTQPEQGRPPLEPHASTIRRPPECSNSYFPPPVDQEHCDPELREPLSLQNEGSSNNNKFLSELDTKLLRAAQSSIPPTAVSKSEWSNDGYAQEDEGFLQPEPEPRLRIKRSMNFGSQLGGKFP